MSKKVLKLAGRRPMLLALIIMATLTIGLLFSGWFTPTPGRAQQGGGNGGSNNENTNCPNYVTNAPVVVCPSIANQPPYYGPYTFCLAQHSSDPNCVPEVNNPPVATVGYIITSVTETCSNITTYTTNVVTWTFAGLNYYINSIPNSDSPPGTYTRDCYFDVISSDPTNCPGPGTIDHHTVTWNIIDTNSVKVSRNIDLSAIAEVVNDVEQLLPQGACTTAPPGNIVIEIQKETSDTCCSDGSIGKKVTYSGGGSIGLGAAQCDFPFAGVPYVVSANVTFNASASVELLISGEYDCGNLNSVCGNITITGQFGGGASIIVASRKFIYASLTIQVGGITGTGQYCFNADGTQSGSASASIGSIDLVGQITFFGGWTEQVDVPLSAGSTFGPWQF